jgi:DNA-binding transcriptional regulator YiaG
MKEEWRDIKGFYGDYKISNFGKIKSLKHGKEKILKIHKHNNGYNFITLSHNGNQKGYLLHRVVVKAFLGDIPDGLDVNHKDGDKDNNFLNNLEVVTKSENQNHAARLGLKPCGEKHKNSKLTESQIKEIREDNRKTPQHVFAKKFGVARSLISMIQNNKIWKQI